MSFLYSPGPVSRLAAYQSETTASIARIVSVVSLASDLSASSEEPRPGLFGFSMLGAASCALKLDPSELRHTYPSDRPRRPAMRMGMRKIKATGGGQVAQK